MAYDEKLANRIREALVNAGAAKIEEKKMFRGLCFMVKGKMCVCASADELMVRFDPVLTDDILEKPGIRPMMRNNKAFKGYAYVSQDVIRSKKDFNYWIDLALAFNKDAKAAKKRSKK